MIESNGPNGVQFRNISSPFLKEPNIGTPVLFLLLACPNKWIRANSKI